MTFLQPWMLAALPLAAIPIIIHLINQRRYQTQKWAAMMFLLTANRMTRGYARVRQWAILIVRTLVIAALVIAIGRPLASGSLGGGWIGSMTGGGSANTIVLLDRSPSMQHRQDGGSSKLETGIAQLSETLRTLGTKRILVIESNSNLPRELTSPLSLLELPQAGPSDASADIPAMLLAALDYIQANQLGQTDIWLCSDLRDHDWRAKDARWASLREAFAELERRVRFRLLAYPQAAGTNRSVRVHDVRLEQRDADASVSLSVNINGDQDAASYSPKPIPVTIELEGARSTLDIPFDRTGGEVKAHRIAVPRGQARGWGRVSIPSDGSPADNDFYFTYETAPPRRAVIVTSDAEAGRVLELAAGTSPGDEIRCTAEVVAPDAIASIAWDEISLVLWQAPLADFNAPPQSDREDDQAHTQLQAFVERGGTLICFPPAELAQGAEPQLPFGLKWGSWNEAQDAAVASWRGDADLLANTLAGASLPVGTLRIHRFASMVGDATPLATLVDGSPLLARVATPRGAMYVCATTPRAKDSSLAADGVVLYVMIQRALQAGAKSLQAAAQLDAGEATAQAAAHWQPLAKRDAGLSSEHAFTAGVYADERRWWAVNRSAAEDRSATLSDSQVDQLFRGLIVDRVNPASGGAKSLVEEVWRAFLILMLVTMLGEACLCLPRKLPKTMAEPRGSLAA